MIWIIGGTKDSSTLIKAIASVTNDYLVTVTTPEATKLYNPVCSVVVGKMNRVEMAQFCVSNGIKAIIDASHPFALAVSQNAIAITQNFNLPYIRYERELINSPHSPLERKLDSFATLLQGNYLCNQRVLLTVGCNALPLFQPWHDRATLFARILPKLSSVQIALDSGFSSDRLIALRPPVSEALEVALWQQWQISLVVTKASGKSGGEEMKRQVATRLGIPLITIARPHITYPQQTYHLQEIVLFCQRVVND